MGVTPCVSASPTVTQNMELAQLIPKSRLSPAVAGLGLGTTVQDVPFHCSANVNRPLDTLTSPVAMHHEVETQDTP